MGSSGTIGTWNGTELSDSRYKLLVLQSHCFKRFTGVTCPQDMRHGCVAYFQSISRTQALVLYLSLTFMIVGQCVLLQANTKYQLEERAAPIWGLCQAAVSGA